MAYASITFFIVCGLPLIAILYYMIRKDKNKRKGIYGLVILIFLLVATVLAIKYLSKDFNMTFKEVKGY